MRKFKEVHDLLFLEDQTVTLTSLTGTKWQCCSSPSACRESSKRGFQRRGCARKYISFCKMFKMESLFGQLLIISFLLMFFLIPVPYQWVYGSLAVVLFSIISNLTAPPPPVSQGTWFYTFFLSTFHLSFSSHFLRPFLSLLLPWKQDSCSFHKYFYLSSQIPNL